MRRGRRHPRSEERHNLPAVWACRAKTRLTTSRDVAAASLLDTSRVAGSGAVPVVTPEGLAARLAAAHADIVGRRPARRSAAAEPRVPRDGGHGGEPVGGPMTAAFDDALATQRCWLRLDDGERHELPVWRWHAEPDETDELMLHRCWGPTLDVGCGPGRLTGALRERGTVTLGIDTSPRAVSLTSRRGGIALRQSVFDRVPGEGAWQHVLLADGNLGIGGDPPALLGRVAQLLGPGGTVIVEVDPPGSGLRCGHARIGSGQPFPWSLVGADAVETVASRAGFRTIWDASRDDRWFAELARR